MALTQCPECEGNVSTEADACPHCGKPLNPPKTPEEGEDNKPTQSPEKQGDGLGLALQMVPWAFMVVYLFIYGSSLMLFAGSAVCCCVLVAIDASRLGFGKEKGDTTAAGWAAGQILLWAVAYPWYMFARKRKGARSRGVGALVNVVVMSATVFRYEGW